MKTGRGWLVASVSPGLCGGIDCQSEVCQGDGRDVTGKVYEINCLHSTIAECCLSRCIYYSLAIVINLCLLLSAVGN